MFHSFFCYVCLQLTVVIRDEKSGLGLAHSTRGMDTGGDDDSAKNRNKMIKRFQDVVKRESQRGDPFNPS